MSLDVYLMSDGEEVYSSNITHNLGMMAKVAGVYYPLWRPEELKVKKAKHIHDLLLDGLELLKSDPERFSKFDSPNKWGVYKNLVVFVEEYITACEKYPDADIIVSR